ncbi:2'-5' RNA ligase family protein [Deinococcota bacterium DY0809b]
MYGILAWPPDDLSEWMQQLSEAHGVSGYGPPHLNLRQPFKWRWSQEALRRGVEGILRGHEPFRVRLGDWRTFGGGVVYLRAYGGGPFQRLYHALEPLAEPEQEIEGPSYIPHLTLALGLSDDEARELAVKLPPPPRKSFTVREVALVTDDDGGELIEIARLPLGSLENQETSRPA